MFVYLPADYHKDTTRYYPVHYVWDAPLTATIYHQLMRLNALQGAVPQCIVVGLSSEGRRAYLNIQDKAADYLRFLHKEVIPFIDTHYRAMDYKVLAGHSAGGNFTLYTLLKQPYLFDAHIAGSPGPVQQATAFANQHEVDWQMAGDRFLYASIGGQEDTSSFRAFADLMRQQAPKARRYYLQVHPGENHLSNLAVNFQNGFRQLYKNWKFQLPENLNQPASEVLKEHYQALAEEFGYVPHISQWEVLFPAMDQLAKRGDLENAIDILHYTVELYPESDQAYAFLAKACFDSGQLEQGKKHLKKALELNSANRYAKRIQQMLERE